MVNKPRERCEGLRVADLLTAGTLTVRSDREGMVHTICVGGELDLHTAARLEHELTRVETTDAQSIVVDLSGLSFIDSTGVRLLFNAHARSRSDGGRLALLRGPQAVQHTFELTGILDRLPFTD
ncbi:MAG TPA: STAS domain-containing protein [Solirubrobacteraceae bacterium]|nr:STAS domain-containing protein [Solirubrobacteraceae bacterium]